MIFKPKAFVITLLLPALICALLSCSSKTGNNNESAAIDTAAAIPDTLVVSEGGSCGYTVVRPDVASDIVVAAAIKICRSIEDETGARPAITTDWEDNPVLDREIVVGQTTREQTENQTVDYESLGAEGYIVKAVGERIYVSGGSDEAVAAAADYFIKNCVKNGAALVDSGYSYVYRQTFDIEALTISGVSIGEYIISAEGYGGAKNAAQTLSDDLWQLTGIKPDVVENADPNVYEHIIVVTTDKPEESGLHLVVNEGGVLTFSSSAESGVSGCVSSFVAYYLAGASGRLNIPDGFIYAVAGDYLTITDPRG